ncbi:RNA polymerase factor sigma-54 [Thermoactinomyces sp. CICC 10522]|uniref:RNA polymerase factor sigma-54 n=1 Tax=Thermoactinomyces sp. CICC 10522 TaxID=2767427 RepID=UPI0018DC9A7F|nr:RNA polymerase factor sigma-54 [Thermoactinomyces sp. CICC 10522]MBH8605035.1 RNA polymerase factor sigma-54 [Thermoactinomyces sp. CICC 10522]
MAIQMGYGLYQEQRMKMVMTPELRQAIQILQFSASDLWQYIIEQMTENPVLELPDLEAERLNLDKWLNYLQEMPVSRRRGGYRQEQKESVFEPYAAGSGTLAEELEAQLFEFDLTPAKRKICHYLIYNLDERGYLDVDAVHVCKRFHISEKRFEECLEVIQAMEPAGVGARSLSECLEIQLKRMDHPNPLAIEIARHHLEDVADGKWRKMEQALGAGMEELQAAVDEIKKCNPRPGRGYDTGAPTQYVYPDVYVEKVNDEYVVVMNESDTPQLTVNHYYQQLIRSRGQIGEEVEQYLKNWLQSALWLIKGIEQRRDTVFRVAEAIVTRQKEFFEKGVDYLKPLTLKTIAEEVGLHESTVSRATQHKYMQTPKGLFPFRYFFPSGLATKSGENLSQETVKKKIKQFISGEDKKDPLSDQKIADLLCGEGIRISRRTVAKYRDEMGIVSSARRKRFL